MIQEITTIGSTQSGLPVLEAYSMGYGKIKFSDDTVLKDNFSKWSRKDHQDAASLNKSRGLSLMNSFRENIGELLDREFDTPVFNPNQASQYTTKDSFTEKDFKSLSSDEVDQMIEFIQREGYEGKIQGAFYMYYYHTRKLLTK